MLLRKVSVSALERRYRDCSFAHCDGSAIARSAFMCRRQSLRPCQQHITSASQTSVKALRADASLCGGSALGESPFA